MPVLIAAPIGGKKQYSINLWLEWIANQDYPHYNICLCTNGEGKEELNEKIKQIEIIDKHGQQKRVISLSLPKSETLTTIQRITYSREMIRRYALEQGYHYIFFLDTDTIPANKDAIERLMIHRRPCISGLYFYKNSKVAVVIDLETGTNINIEKCKEAVEKGEIIEVWGFGFGCLLLSKEAFKYPFDYNLFGEERTDDFGYCEVLDQNQIKRYLDPFVLCKHFSDRPEALHKINDMILIRNGKNKDRAEDQNKGMDQ